MKIHACCVYGFCIFFLSSCAASRATGNLGRGLWRTGLSGAKVLGRTAARTTEFLGKQTYRGIRSSIYMAKGKVIVPLEEEHGSFYVSVVLNKRIKARLVLDTGASSVQISQRLAQRLGIGIYSGDGDPVLVTMADGQRITARMHDLAVLQVGGAKVTHVPVIVFDDDQGEDGLLGMSFLKHFDFQINPQVPELILEQKHMVVSMEQKDL